MRSLITGNQRLTTLRYLATDPSFEDLKFTITIAQSLSKIIIETYEALIIVLNDCIK